MNEVLRLESEIMAALPAADLAACMMDRDALLHAVVRDAHDILCNAWTGPGERLDRLRTLAEGLRRFNP